MDLEQDAIDFQEGLESAFTRLYEAQRERLYRIAYRITLNAEDAMDVVEDSFVKVHLNIQAWDRRASFLSWLTRITTNLAIDVVRRRGRERKMRDRLIAEQGENLVIAPPGEDPIDREELQRLAARARDAIAELPASQRAIVSLRLFEGYALQEIAELRGCALGTVKSTLHQALKRLTELLSDELEAVRTLTT